MNLLVRTDPFDSDYTLNYAFWYTKLSNGETIYGEDRYDLPIPSAWKRLSSYLNRNNAYINTFHLCFRSNEIVIDVSEKKYLYFSKAVGKEWGDNTEDHFFVVGCPINEYDIECIWYKIPELTEFKRNLTSIDSFSQNDMRLHLNRP